MDGIKDRVVSWFFGQRHKIISDDNMFVGLFTAREWVNTIYVKKKERSIKSICQDLMTIKELHQLN